MLTCFGFLMPGPKLLSPPDRESLGEAWPEPCESAVVVPITTAIRGEVPYDFLMIRTAFSSTSIASIVERV